MLPSFMSSMPFMSLSLSREADMLLEEEDDEDDEEPEPPLAPPALMRTFAASSSNHLSQLSVLFPVNTERVCQSRHTRRLIYV